MNNGGIPLHLNHFVVYDLDIVDKDSKEIDEDLLRRAQRCLSKDEPIAVVQTASGGYHVFLRSSDHLNARKKLKAFVGAGTTGVDLLCGKSHVVSAGSNICGRRYIPVRKDEDPR